MNRFKISTTIIAMVFSLSSYAGSGSFVGLTQYQWQPEHSYFGRTPFEFCKITISKNTIAFSDAAQTLLTYRFAHSAPDFIVLEVDAHKTDKTQCIHPRASGKAYWRFDTKSYWLCEAWKPDAKNCPQAFGGWDSRKFEISIFGNINNAINYATEPLDVHGYYQYKEEKE